jgi:hypothetical protein
VDGTASPLLYVVCCNYTILRIVQTGIGVGSIIRSVSSPLSASRSVVSITFIKQAAADSASLTRTRAATLNLRVVEFTIVTSF